MLGIFRRVGGLVVDQIFSYLWGLIAALVLSTLTIALAWFKDIPAPFFVPLGGIAFLVGLVAFVTTIKTRDWWIARKEVVAEGGAMPHRAYQAPNSFFGKLRDELHSLAPMIAFFLVMFCWFMILLAGPLVIAWFFSKLTGTPL